MFARYLFIALGIASLLWVGYVAADLIDQRNAFAPTTIFGKEDGKVLIINKMSETDVSVLVIGVIWVKPRNIRQLNFSVVIQCKIDLFPKVILNACIREKAEFFKRN